VADPDGDGILRHDAGPCPETYPVIDGIPRMLLGYQRQRVVDAHRDWFGRTAVRRALAEQWSRAAGETGMTARVVAGFDDEWERFDHVGTADDQAMYEQYFDLIGPELFGEDRIVLDAGCGAGRWAFRVASQGPRVIAVDLGQSVDIARRNTMSSGRVACVQADLRDLPLCAGSVDWAYSLGVLHHIDRPETALRQIAEAVRPGGQVLLYLYYALDNRGPVYRGLFRAIDGLRRITSRLPRPVLVPFAAAVATAVYWPLARMSRTLDVLGAHEAADALPLAFYRERSLRVMINDSVDRFGTELERRYTREDLTRLADAAGLGNPSFSSEAPYWHAIVSTREAGSDCAKEKAR
jgi:SAM-dependent methyltransferase